MSVVAVDSGLDSSARPLVAEDDRLLVDLSPLSGAEERRLLAVGHEAASKPYHVVGSVGHSELDCLDADVRLPASHDLRCWPLERDLLLVKAGHTEQRESFDLIHIRERWQVLSSKLLSHGLLHPISLFNLEICHLLHSFGNLPFLLLDFLRVSRFLILQ